MTWYESWFNSEYYLKLYKHRDDEDAQKILSLIFREVPITKGSRVLDLACGSGRHSVLIAKKGLYVTGIDLSKYLIKLAKEKASKSAYKDKLNFYIRDMRDFRFRQKFDLLLNIFSSFGYFKDDTENEKVIKCVSANLKNNGYFVLDFLNYHFLKNNLIKSDTFNMGDSVITQQRKIKNNTVIKDIMIECHGKRHKYTERIKLYTGNQFKKMFNKYGLKIIKTYGDYSGEEFKPKNSPRLILFAQKC